MTPLFAFLLGLAVGALVCFAAVVYLVRVGFPAMRMHICSGHVEHEKQLVELAGPQYVYPPRLK